MPPPITDRAEVLADTLFSLPVRHTWVFMKGKVLSGTEMRPLASSTTTHGHLLLFRCSPSICGDALSTTTAHIFRCLFASVKYGCQAPVNRVRLPEDSQYHLAVWNPVRELAGGPVRCLSTPEGILALSRVFPRRKVSWGVTASAR